MIVLVREMHPDEVLPKLREPGHTIHTSLGNELETWLNAALSAAKSLLVGGNYASQAVVGSCPDRRGLHVPANGLRLTGPTLTTNAW
jgi:hypothetical protein